MHGYVSKLLGDTTAEDSGRLSLNPIKHIDPFIDSYFADSINANGLTAIWRS